MHSLNRAPCQTMEKIRLAIVEDNPTESLMMKLAFGGMEHLEIDHYPDAKALMEANAADPDVLVLDLMLPDMDGLELLARVQKRSPKTRTVIVSAQEDINVIAKAQEAGVYNYVVKHAGCLRYLKRVIEDLLVIVRTEGQSA